MGREVKPSYSPDDIERLLKRGFEDDAYRPKRETIKGGSLALPTVMFFGVHRDEPIDSVPTSYLQWCLEQDWLYDRFPLLVKAIEQELDTRGKDYAKT